VSGTVSIIKFIYSEKATNFFEISTVDLSYVVPVKSTVEISQNFMAFSEYMNFKFNSKVVPQEYMFLLAGNIMPGTEKL
jgi:hypothetical protein